MRSRRGEYVYSSSSFLEKILRSDKTVLLLQRRPVEDEYDIEEEEEDTMTYALTNLAEARRRDKTRE